MPQLALEDNVATDAQILFWQIAEPPEFFARRLHLSPDDQRELTTVTHPEKRLQWLAARHALMLLIGPEAMRHLRKDAHRRPYLANNAWHVSISHTEGFVAVAASVRHPVGVDIEQLGQPRDFAVRRMFMNDTERQAYDDLLHADPALAEVFFYRVWCSKEVLYKMHALAGHECSFKRHLATEDAHVLSDRRFTGRVSMSHFQTEHPLFTRHYGNLLTVFASGIGLPRPDYP